MPKLSSLGEFGLIARLQKILPPPVGKAWSVGIGDDTAVHSLGRGRSQLFTQDLLLEGIHFLPGTPRVWEDIGWKAMAVNLSDLAAMGGDPLGAVIGLGLPKRAKIPEIEALYRGIAQASRRFKCPVVGGDTNISKSGWVIAVAMLGETPRKPLLRSAARAGDSLWVISKKAIDPT